MAKPVLQKSAHLTPPEDLPVEVLYPKIAAQQYVARMLAPSSELAPWVAHHWVLSWDLRGKPPFTCEVIPSPSVNLTFMREGARITGVATGKYAYQLAEQGIIFGTQHYPARQVSMPCKRAWSNC